MARPPEETIVIALRTAIMPGLANDQVAGAFVSWLKITKIGNNHDAIIFALRDVDTCFPNLSEMIDKTILHIQEQKREVEVERRRQRIMEQ